MIDDETNNYQPTIGLEIHAQLKTKTKLFSSSPNNSEIKEPNTIVSPIDAAHPGTLPAINYEAIKKVIQVGLAMDSDIADYTEWDRKNYFYPDIPKAYQISQYKYPLVTGGKLSDVAITRIHLEEDTGKSQHDQGDYSLVDLNRAGMPLMELVTEPVIHSAQQASEFAKELQLLMRYLGAGDANLEKGEMRIEANISVSDSEKLGTKVEVKNINSFKAVEKAIEYEINRQIEILESGGNITQETRGWDEENSRTFSQRAKEDAHDYRYFPDPDLPKLIVSEVFDLESIKADLPETPSQRRAVLLGLGIAVQQVELLLQRLDLYTLLSQVIAVVDEKSSSFEVVKLVNLLCSNLIGFETDDQLIGSIDNVLPGHMLEILDLQATHKISSNGANALLVMCYEGKLDPQQNIEFIAKEHTLIQTNDSTELEALVEQIISEQTVAVEKFRAGEEQVIQFLVGQGMKLSKGSANPQMLRDIFIKKISS